MANGFAMVGVQADIEAKQLSRMRGIALHTLYVQMVLLERIMFK